MKEKPVSVRFEKKDLEAAKHGADIEGLDLGPYVRRCTVLATRDKYPEAYAEKDAATPVPR